jgi:hypothetical protein
LTDASRGKSCAFAAAERIAARRVRAHSTIRPQRVHVSSITSLYPCVAERAHKNGKQRNSLKRGIAMRAKPKNSTRASLSSGLTRGSRAARSGRRAGSRPGVRRPPAPRADAAPIDRKPAPGLDPGGGALKHLGGSQSDEWNDLIATETVRARCVSYRPIEPDDIDAVVAGLAGIAPQDEFEGMMAAQLVAGHGTLMECYARAALGAERDESLRQAARLSRAFVQVMGALRRHRIDAGQGRQQKSEKQPHAKDIAPHLVPRLERLRRDYGTREPLEPLSEEELADFAEDGLLLDAMMGREPDGSVTRRPKAPPRPPSRGDAPLSDEEFDAFLREDVRERLPFTDPRAVEQAIVAAAAARAESAEQPHAVPTVRADRAENDGSEKSEKQPSSRPIDAPTAPTAPARPGRSAATPDVTLDGVKEELAAAQQRRIELEQKLAMAERERTELQDQKAEAGRLAKSANNPTTLTRAEALRIVFGPGGRPDLNKVNEVQGRLPPSEWDAFLAIVNERAREQIHGKRPMEWG